MPIVDLVVDWHELNGGDAQLQQVPDSGFGGQAQVGPAQWFGNLGMQLREAAHMSLIDHRLVPGRPQRLVVSPAEGLIGDNAKRRTVGVVPVVEGHVAGGIADAVSEHGVRPAQLSADGPGIRVQENLVGVEPMPVVGIEGTVNPIPVQLTGLDVGQIAVPHQFRLFAQRDAVGFGAVVLGIKQAQFNTCGVFGEDGKVHAGSVPGGAEWIRPTGPDSH